MKFQSYSIPCDTHRDMSVQISQTIARIPKRYRVPFYGGTVTNTVSMPALLGRRRCTSVFGGESVYRSWNTGQLIGSFEKYVEDLIHEEKIRTMNLYGVLKTDRRKRATTVVSTAERPSFDRHLSLHERSERLRDEHDEDQEVIRCRGRTQIPE